LHQYKFEKIDKPSLKFQTIFAGTNETVFLFSVLAFGCQLRLKFVALFSPQLDRSFLKIKADVLIRQSLPAINQQCLELGLASKSRRPNAIKFSRTLNSRLANLQCGFHHWHRPSATSP
jgi:hypothetical protein